MEGGYEMRNAALIALVVASTVACSRLPESTERSKSDSTNGAASASLDLQAKCSRQAPEAIRHFAWENREALEYTAHYNSQRGRCIVAVKFVEFIDGRRHYFHLHAVDAFEFTSYGDYKEVTDLGEPGAPVTALIRECEVGVPTGPKKACQDQREFERMLQLTTGVVVPHPLEQK
jgi:hypothetical protein